MSRPACRPPPATWPRLPNGWRISTRQIGQGLPAFQAPEQQARTSYVTLAELERVGALTIRSRDDTPRRGDVLLRTLGRPPTVATGTSADDNGVAQVMEIDADAAGRAFRRDIPARRRRRAAGGQYAGGG